MNKPTKIIKILADEERVICKKCDGRFLEQEIHEGQKHSYNKGLCPNCEAPSWNLVWETRGYQYGLPF